MTVLTQPLYYWAIYLLLAVAVVIEFWFIHWKTATNAARLIRRIDVLNADDPETRIARLYWTYMYELEAVIARTITVQRAIREHPERVAALLSEDVAFGDVIDAVAS